MKLRVPIPPGLMDDFSSERCVSSGTEVCAWPIPRPEEFYRVVCVSLNVIRCNMQPLHPQWVDTRGQIKKSDSGQHKLTSNRKQGENGKKKVLLENISILLTEEEDTRTGTHSKWRIDVGTGLQPLVKMRKQNLIDNQLRFSTLLSRGYFVQRGCKAAGPLDK
jgi:hypothetical protein